jgi:anti-sigma B factor antagonist
MIATDLVIEQDVKWHEGGTIVLSLTGPLDSYTTEILEARMLKAMNDGARVLYLDMHGIDYISSAGAGAIINARGLAMERGVDLRLVSPSNPVRELFRILGLAEILPFAA